jgi:hypothetical protein
MGKSPEMDFIQVKNSEMRAVLSARHFEFASLKDGNLSICMGHAMGNQDDWIIADENGTTISQLADALDKREGIAVLLNEDGQPFAILNIKNIAYVNWHLDDNKGESEPIEVLDVWYENYGFRLAYEDATNMYENICELAGLEP